MSKKPRPPVIELPEEMSIERLIMIERLSKFGELSRRLLEFCKDLKPGVAKLFAKNVSNEDANKIEKRFWHLRNVGLVPRDAGCKKITVNGIVYVYVYRGSPERSKPSKPR